MVLGFQEPQQPLSNSNSPPPNKNPNLVANESDELESESEEESKKDPNGPLDESLKIVEEIKKKREEEEKLKEEEAEDIGEEPEPEKVVVNETLASLSRDYLGYSQCSAEEIMDKVKKFSFMDGEEEVRDISGHKWGGKICVDKNIVRKSRSIGREIIYEIGKRILSGKLNLTKITFPIKAMVPKSVLENVVHSCKCLFLNLNFSLVNHFLFNSVSFFFGLYYDFYNFLLNIFFRKKLVSSPTI